jgi:hypothetical protein
MIFMPFHSDREKSDFTCFYNSLSAPTRPVGDTFTFIISVEGSQ